MTSTAIKRARHVVDDGGRCATGYFQGRTGDCAVRAMSIVIQHDQRMTPENAYWLSYLRLSLSDYFYFHDHLVRGDEPAARAMGFMVAGSKSLGSVLQEMHYILFSMEELFGRAEAEWDEVAALTRGLAVAVESPGHAVAIVNRQIRCECDPRREWPRDKPQALWVHRDHVCTMIDRGKAASKNKQESNMDTPAMRRPGSTEDPHHEKPNKIPTCASEPPGNLFPEVGGRPDRGRGQSASRIRRGIDIPTGDLHLSTTRALAQGGDS